MRQRHIEVVLVTWVDSEVSGEWTDCAEFGLPQGIIHSAGLLIHKDAEKIVLAVSYDGDNDRANAVQEIPRGCVRSIFSLGAAKLSAS